MSTIADNSACDQLDHMGLLKMSYKLLVKNYDFHISRRVHHL